MKTTGAKKRIYEIVQTANPNDKQSKAFDICILVLILINVILIVLDTFSLPPIAKNISSVIEIISIIIFTIEYIFRIYVADLIFPNITPCKARLKYIFSFMALIDLLAILPFYLPFLFKIDLRVLRALRLLRILRVLKINRYTTALSAIGNVFKRKKHQLISSIFVVSLLMIIAAILMYSIESEAQPEAFENAFAALWWAVATLTTVGYGDVYPVTVLGKMLSAVIALLGIGLVAVPTGIISAGFMEQIEDRNDEQSEKSFCPYCGRKLEK